MSCQTGVIPVSKRDAFPVRTGEIYKKGRKIKGPVSKSETIFKKKTKLDIYPVRNIDRDGSLFSTENPNNFLFYEKPPGHVGDILEVKVISSQAGQQDEGSNQATGDNSEKITDELIQALPQFTPDEKNASLKVSPYFKFKVDKRLANGDLLVSHTRLSETPDQANLVIIKSRIPAQVVLSQRSITTQDMQDIEWYQRADGEEFERYSLTWQDEYSLRLSGFEEVKSKYAKQLDDRKSDLKKISSQLRKRINSLRQEKMNFSRSRQKLLDDQQNLNKNLSEYKGKIQDQQQTIDEQKSILKKQEKLIEDLQGKGTSPGDEKGAGDDG